MSEMNDHELQEFLHKWKPPETPSGLRANVLAQYRKRHKWTWRRFFTGSLQVPVPVASLAMLIIAGLSTTIFILESQSPHIAPLPPQIIRKLVEVPVTKERVVVRTIYRDRVTRRQQAVPASYQGINLRDFLPVASLMPQIIKGGLNVKQN